MISLPAIAEGKGKHEPLNRQLAPCNRIVIHDGITRVLIPYIILMLYMCKQYNMCISVVYGTYTQAYSSGITLFLHSVENCL